MEKELKQNMKEKSPLTKEENKALKRAKKERKRIKAEKEQKLKKERFIKNYKGNAEEHVYAFKRRFKLSKKVAIQEYKAFGYKVTPEQNAFIKKKETTIKLHRQKRKEAKRKRALAQEMEDYKQSVIHDFLETQEIEDIETWLIIKDEFF